MKKIFTLLSISLLGVSQAQHCIPQDIMCIWEDKIVNVKVGDRENPTDCSATGYTDYYNSFEGFEMLTNTANEIQVTVGDGYFHETVMMWVDFNQNNEFELDEYFFIGTEEFPDHQGLGLTKTITQTITLPANVAEGEYRMRLRVVDGEEQYPQFPCDIMMVDDEDQIEFVWPFGEMEDYKLMVKAGESQGEYCMPIDIMCFDDDQIHHVKFNTIDQASTCDEETGYNDFTHVSTNVDKGQTYNLEVTIGSGWKYESVGVWIDYNQDFEFTEDEFTLVGTHIYPSNSNDGLTAVLQKEITIPTTAKEGETRMRLRIQATGTDQPDVDWSIVCQDEDFGEIEDYTLVIGNLNTVEINKSKFEVYNTENQLNIKSETLINKAELYSFDGKLVMTKNLNDRIASFNSNGAKQVYILKVYFADGTIQSKKVLF